MKERNTKGFGEDQNHIRIGALLPLCPLPPSCVAQTYQFLSKPQFVIISDLFSSQVKLQRLGGNYSQNNNMSFDVLVTKNIIDISKRKETRTLRFSLVHSVFVRANPYVIFLNKVGPGPSFPCS